MRKKSKTKLEKPKKSFSLKVMKVYLILFILGLGSTISAVDTYSQAMLSLKFSNIKMEKLFAEIEKNSDYVILYKKGVIENKVVSVDTKNESVEGVLNKVLPPLDLTYHINGNQIVIVENPRRPEKTETRDAKEEKQRASLASGKVSDVSGVPLAGVSVVEKGTTNGTMTDVDGRFSIRVNPNATLVITYIGFQNKELKAATDMQIVLEEESTELDDVVVVGYGVQKKVNLTGSVATVDSKLLADRPISNVSAGLAGLLPGVSVVQSSGLPGHDKGTIRIRGAGTLNAGVNPMVIVDGVEATMENVDVNDIESISVLKDAGSSAIYGSKAANGVILITTKRGKVGKTVVNYAGNFGWQSPTRLPDYMNSADYAELYNEALKNDNPNNSPRWTAEQIELLRNGSDPDNYPNTDWQDLLYKGSGFQTSHNLSFSGGTDRIKYMASLSYLDQAGVIKHTSKKQYNVRTNLDIKVTSKLDFGVNLSYTRMDLQEPTNSYVGGGVDQIFRQVNLISPWIPYRKSNGDYGTIGDGNPIAWIDLDQTIDKKRAYFLGIGSLRYNIIDNLFIKGILSYKTYTQDELEFIKDIQYNPNKYHGPNKMNQKDNSDETVSTDLLLNYDKTFALKHNLSLMAGFHSEYYHSKEIKAYRQNFPSNDLRDMNAGSEAGMKNEGYTRELAMLSWFGRANYNYMGKYLLEANFRYDGSSRFAEGNRWGLFPSFSAGWRISEEEFMESLRSTISNLKLRGSWGKLGNQAAISGDYYPTVPTITLKDKGYPFNGGIVQGGATQYAKNPNLQWEKSRSWGIGLDLGILNDLNITLDYYDRLTTDIIMEVPSPETFALEKFYDNVGKMSNKGFEVGVTYNKKIDQVMLAFGGNFSYNKNKILELAGQNVIFGDDGNYIKMIGRSYKSLYGYLADGLYQSQEEIDNGPNVTIRNNLKPGDLKYVDVNKDGKVDAEDRVIIGNSEPKYSFGFNLGAEYRGFDILAFFQGAAGVEGYLNSEAIGEIRGDVGKPTTYWKDRWTPENTNTSVPRVSARGTSAPSSPALYSSYWVQNANYLRLKNLQVGYTIPMDITKKIGITKARIYYSGQNLLTFTSFLKGWDPEAPVGRGSHYPQVMVNTFGVNVTF